MIGTRTLKNTKTLIAVTGPMLDVPEGGGEEGGGVKAEQLSCSGKDTVEVFTIILNEASCCGRILLLLGTFRLHYRPL